jgi:diacylglycerol kinase family enzyme
LHRATPLDMPTLAWRAFSARARVLRHRQVTGLQGLGEFTVRTTDGRELPLQVDGDYVGHVAEARYSISPQALNVVA